MTKKIKIADDKGRLCIGKEFANVEFDVKEQEDGTIFLTPVKETDKT